MTQAREVKVLKGKETEDGGEQRQGNVEKKKKKTEVTTIRD